MKNYKFYIIVFFILFLIFEIFSFFIVDNKLNKLQSRLPPETEMSHNAIKNYIKYLPYVRERNLYLYEEKHSAFDNNYFIYDIINEYKYENNENILIQGDLINLILSSK